MNKESIIREWFYRLPNGYATAPYSKKEMDVLHEVLAENELNGSIFIKEVDQLDQAFLDAHPVTKNLKEQEQGEDIKSLTKDKINFILLPHIPNMVFLYLQFYLSMKVILSFHTKYNFYMKQQYRQIIYKHQA